MSFKTPNISSERGMERMKEEEITVISLRHNGKAPSALALGDAMFDIISDKSVANDSDTVSVRYRNR